MKYYAYIAVFAFLASCSTTRNLAIEDDIYYVPGKKSLAVQEIESASGGSVPSASGLTDQASRTTGSSQKPGTTVINTRNTVPDQVDLSALTGEARELLKNRSQIDTLLYENTGYWIGGYKGSEYDLNEIQRIINQYPDGFAYFNGNGADIAMNLAFDPDWNVYTDNGRYWWFPSSSNLNLYSSLIMGNYPKYIWTVIWDNPSFNSLAFTPSWNFNFGWGSPGWSFGFGWNSGWYDPWYGSWYNPWYGGWGYPYWYDPYWHHHHWHGPVWGGGSQPSRPPRPGIPVRPGISRPGPGGHIVGVRPGARPGVSGSRPSVSRPSGITRPGTGSSIRPDMNRPSGTTRPLPSGVRPGNTTTTVRPGSSTTRPGTVARPSSGMTRPGTATRPSSNGTRPGTVTRPNSAATRPGTTTRPGSITRPGTTTRPGTISRPGKVSRPSSQYTRPSNTGTAKSYSRPQPNYRPTYNTNSSSRYSPGRSNSSSSYSGNSSSSYRSSGGSSSRSSGVSRPSTPVRNSGGPRR